MMLRIPALVSRKEVQAVRKLRAETDWQDGKATTGHLSAPPAKVLPPRFNRYHGGSYGNHIDNALFVNPVTSGTRFANFFWAQSLIKSPEQRRLLFGLDRSTQQRTADSPLSSQIASPSGTDHNLLRMWAEV